MAISFASQSGGNVYIYNEKGKLSTYIGAGTGKLADFNSSSVSIVWGSQMTIYNEKGKRIGSRMLSTIETANFKKRFL
jgi:hypothetical protein